MRKITTEDGVHHSKEKIETGALQINDDKPGLFIRSEDCLEIVAAFEKVRQLGFRWAIPTEMLNLEKVIKEEVWADKKDDD